MKDVRTLTERIQQQRQNTRDQLLQSWLATPLGQSLIEHERRVVEEAFEGIFGEECLQLGLWGEAQSFLRYSRSQRTMLLVPEASRRASRLASEPRCVAGQLHRLPIASDSVDLVFLPHTLEYSTRPHAILREVHRVLRSDGHLIVLGFKQGGLWGVRRLIPGAGLPPATEQLIADRRLKDWLNLLDLHIHGLTRYFFRWPLPGIGGALSQTWEHRGQSWWPQFAACYMLTAQKRMLPMTHVRKAPWRSTPKVVAGLVKPSTRTSRIRFDNKS